MCCNLDILKDIINNRKSDIQLLHSKGILTNCDAYARIEEMNILLAFVQQKQKEIKKFKKFETIMFIICSSLIGLCQIFYMYQLVCHDDLKCGILAILLLVITYRR